MNLFHHGSPPLRGRAGRDKNLVAARVSRDPAVTKRPVTRRRESNVALLSTDPVVACQSASPPVESVKNGASGLPARDSDNRTRRVG